MSLTRCRPGGIAAITLASGAGSACGARSIFHAAGPAAQSLASLGWFVLATFGATTVIMWALIWWVAYRRRGTLAEHAPVHVEGGVRWILIGGFAVPAAVLAIVFVVTLQSMSAFPLEHASGDPQIHVYGHRWWFEAEYRIGNSDQWFKTATELHIPTGRPVVIALETRDVIHSFWVPELHGKVDLMPGQVNQISIQADAPGTFGGQCAEFCGKNHANMRLVVVADAPQDFDRWLAQQRQRAAAPGTDSAARGKQLVEQTACAMCHTIRGTPALATVGPDLTHVGSRSRIAGGMLANNIANLHAWVTHAQSLKPGAAMPDLTQYNGDDLHAIVDYLRSLQ